MPDSVCDYEQFNNNNDFAMGFDDGEGGYEPAYPDNKAYMDGFNCGRNAPW